MDPLSVTASVIAVTQLGVKTFSLVKKVVNSYREIPADILALKLQLDGINIQLHLLGNIQETLSHGDLLLNVSEAAGLESFIQDIALTFSQIRDAFSKQLLSAGKRDRIKWVLHDADKAKKWDKRLQSHSSVLRSVLQLLEIRYSGLLKEEFKDLKHEIALARNLMAMMHQPLQTQFLWSKRISGVFSLLSQGVKLNGSIVSLERGQESIYSVSLTFQMLFFAKAICLDFKLRRNSLLSAHISPYFHGLTIKNTIPDDSEFITACKGGDHSAVWSLLHGGKASVHDIAQNNDTPLRWAIESGSLELVSLLLTLGANPKGTFGSFHSNYIQAAFYFRRIDIARLLLSRGADIHHICARGWTPIFHLWQGRDVPDQVDEYFQFLSSSSFSDFDLQDSVGWTALHRAAAFGTAADIEFLLSQHASLATQTSVFSWTPIFCAVQHGNLTTFNELKQHYPDLLTLVDGRRWTLLHVAVNAERLELISLLLSLGADPHARSMATDLRVPKDLVGVSATPSDIALLRGEEVRSVYVDGLRSVGWEVELIGDEKEGTEDIFWAF